MGGFSRQLNEGNEGLLGGAGDMWEAEGCGDGLRGAAK